MKLCLKKNRLVQKLWTALQNFVILTGRTLRLRKRLWAYNAPAKKSIEISQPWHSFMIPVADMNHDIVRGKLKKSLKPQNPAKPWSPKDFFGGYGYYTHNTQGYIAKLESLVIPSRPLPAECTAEDQPFFTYPGTLKILVLESISHQGQLHLQPPN